MKILDLKLKTPIHLAFYRYGYLYITQGNTLTICSNKQHSSTDLSFTPTRMASYGGVVFLVGDTGYAKFSGIDLLEEREDSHVGIVLNEVREGVQDYMGVPFEKIGNVYSNRLNGRAYYSEPKGCLSEIGTHLVFLSDTIQFAELNNNIGELLYSQAYSLPAMIIPYAYTDKHLFAGGYDGGYVFSPDGGLSWRTRKLNGWGVLTPKAVLSVEPDGVYSVTGGTEWL